MSIVHLLALAVLKMSSAETNQSIAEGNQSIAEDNQSIAEDTFEYFADAPCTSEYLGGVWGLSLQECFESCPEYKSKAPLSNPCTFVSYCPPDGNCTGGNVHKCSMYAGQCEGQNPAFVGYSTYRRIPGQGQAPTPAASTPAPAKEEEWSFEYFANYTCNWGFTYRENRPSLQDCLDTCVPGQYCNFVAYCPSTDERCTGGNANMCARYTGQCEDQNPYFAGYTLYKRVPAPAPTPASTTTPVGFVDGATSAPAWFLGTLVAALVTSA